MSRKKIPSIPFELQQIKAYDLSQQQLLEGKESNSDDDWNDAGKYLAKHPNKVLFWKLSKLFAQADTRAFALDVVKTAIAALGLIATFVAGVGLFVNYWSSEKNIQLTQERLVTDRLSKAVDQLGSGKDEIILGGIYSLERIAKDSPKDRATIMEVLSAFIRRNSPAKHEITIILNRTPSQNSPVNITVQAALTVIGRRKHRDDKIYKDFIDLNGANLSYADLSHADLSDAFLVGADLSNADLIHANLAQANLMGANLSNAVLIYAKNFTPRQIKNACNWDKLRLHTLHAINVDELKQDRDSEPKESIDCSRWKAKN